MHMSFLLKSLELATISRGFCAPNPAVGALVVKDNKILAQGFHRGSGQPHAEVEALKNLGENANGATLYVSLEPCCHFGKTPPCTDLLIQRGIKQVVFGFRDPNPQVTGKSEKILRAAGIEYLHVPAIEIDTFYQSYAFWWQHKKPFVTAKLAMSLDGKIAGANGTRVNITNKDAQLFTHQQRKLSDAILTTIQTIQKDDPLLNVRLANIEYKKPLYILDSQLATPLSANIFSSTKSITLFHTDNVNPKKLQALKAQGAHCVVVPGGHHGLDLDAVLAKIGNDGIHDLWIEAGGQCFSSFLKQQLLQKAYIYIAPKWLGAQAQNAFVEDHDIFATVQQKNWQILGEDMVCEMRW